MRFLPALLALAALAAPVQAQQPSFTVPVSAVSSALAGKNIALAAEHIHLSTTVPSAVPDPTLRLLAVDQQPDGTLAARLACQSPAECRPFFATLVPFDRAQAATILQAFHESAPAPQLALAAHTGVTVGALVTLRLSDRQMRIQLQGVAIDSAPPGYQVRVSSLDRHHTWRGVVVDTSTVEGDLP